MSRQNETAPADPVTVVRSIRRIVRAMDVRSKRVARETGLTIPQIVVLQAVRDFEAATTAAISRHANISAATTVTILEKLEARGIVERHRSTVDRRIVHSRLTERGRALLAEAPPLFHEAFFARFGELPPDEQATIVRAFCTVADILDPDEVPVGTEAGISV